MLPATWIIGLLLVLGLAAQGADVEKADLDPTTALAAKVAENERRRDYTRPEIKELAERLIYPHSSLSHGTETI